MIYVYYYRNPEQCPFPYAEVKDGFPVHPGELQERVRALLKAGQPFATCSDVVLSLLGWMIRRKEIETPPLRIMYVYADGTSREIMYDTKGQFIQYWPEEGWESAVEAGFYYRYTD